MTQMPNNPYQPSQQQAQFNPGGGSSTGKVTAPGIALMVVGGLSTLHHLFAIVTNLIFSGQQNMQGFEGNEQMRQFAEQMQEMGPMINVIAGLVGLILSVLVVVGGFMMMKRSGYGLAMTGAIVAIVPCTGIMDCCLVEIGMGIWALVVLLQADVKRMF